MKEYTLMRHKIHVSVGAGVLAHARRYCCVLVIIYQHTTNWNKMLVVAIIKEMLTMK